MLGFGAGCGWFVSHRAVISCHRSLSMDATANNKDSQSKGQWQLCPEKKNQLDLLYLSVSAHNACRMPHVLILAQVLLHSIFLHSFYSFKITHVNRFMQYYCNNFLLVRYCKGFEFSPNMLQIQSDNRYTSHTANNNRAG